MTLAVVALAWLALAGTGWLVLAPLARAQRDALLPAAPVFGIVLLVVVLHDTTIVVSVRVGVWVVAAVLVGLGVVATRRDPTWWRPSRRALATLALAAACGVLPAVWALGPSFAVGDSDVIQPSSNNDAFYYVTVADWLQDHPATDVPETGRTPEDPGVPPSFASARSQLTLNVRIGQELTQAALTTVLGSDEERTWYPLTALWVLLMPAAGVAAARLLRLHLVTGLAVGLMTSVSALVVFQLAAQNSASLLGTCLVLLAVPAVLAVLDPERRIAVACAGLVLTALIGTYTEFTTLVGPALVAAVVVRRPRDLVRALRSASGILAVAVAVAPWVWVRAVKSLVTLGGLPSDNLPTAFSGAPLQVIAGRFLGIALPDATAVSILLLVVLVAFAGIGIVAAALLTHHRWCYLTLIAVGLFLSVYLVTVRHRAYTQQRLVQLLLPLVVLVVAAGWDAWWCANRGRRAARARRRRPAPAWRARAVALAGLVGAVVFVVSNSVIDHRLDLTGQARSRHVGPEFAEAAGWIRQVGGADGRGASVLVGDFFSQLWITDALRDEPDVSYPSLYVSYQYQTSYWDGQPRRWLLTDRQAIRSVGPHVVVRRNDRFALLDLSRGRAVVAVPADVFGQNSFLVLRSARGPDTVDLVGATRPRAATDVPAGPGYGDPVASGDLRSGTTEVPVDLGDGVARRLVLSNAEHVFMLSGLRFASPDASPAERLRPAADGRRDHRASRAAAASRAGVRQPSRDVSPRTSSSRVMAVSTPGEHDPTGYDEAYYDANGQAGDRPALRLYTRLIDRYAGGAPYLDFGCGTGHLLRRLSALGPSSGLEVSEYSARIARANAPDCRVVTDPEDLPTAGFASMTSIHVLEHLPDQLADETLATWRRVLKPGGKALVVMPDPAGRGHQLAGADWGGFKDPTHINLKPHAAWKTFIAARGFDVEREGSDGLWNVPYSRLPKLVDAGVHAVPALVQFAAGRMLLRPGTGESSFFLLRRSGA